MAYSFLSLQIRFEKPKDSNFNPKIHRKWHQLSMNFPFPKNTRKNHRKTKVYVFSDSLWLNFVFWRWGGFLFMKNLVEFKFPMLFSRNFPLKITFVGPSSFNVHWRVRQHPWQCLLPVMQMPISDMWPAAKKGQD